MPRAGLERLTVKDAPHLVSLDGLATQEALRHLEIRAARRLGDISVLAERAASLEKLKLEKCRSIDSLEPLAAFRRLRFLKIGDCGDLPAADELQGLISLEVLYAWGTTCFLDGDLSALTQLPALTEIRMQNRRHYHPAVADISSAISHER
jgi:hypothetical protein